MLLTIEEIDIFVFRKNANRKRVAKLCNFGRLSQIGVHLWVLFANAEKYNQIAIQSPSRGSGRID